MNIQNEAVISPMQLSIEEAKAIILQYVFLFNVNSRDNTILSCMDNEICEMRWAKAP